MTTIDTSQTHDGIYVRDDTTMILVRDEDIRQVMDRLHRTHQVQYDNKTLPVPQEEVKRVLQKLLERLKVYESSNTSN